MTGILTRYEDEAIPPSQDYSSDYRLQWCMTGMLEGEQYLRNQPLYEKAAETREYLLGFKNTFRGALGLSDIQVNELWRVYNILAGDWTDINPFWYFASENARWQRQARINSKLATINYRKSGSDAQVNLMVRQSLESGSGVLGVQWDRWRRDLGMSSWNPDDVLPIRPTDPYSYQGCMAVCARREVTVNFAHQMFPQYKDHIKMDRDAATSGLGMRHRDMLRSRLGAGSVSAFEIVDMQDALPVQHLGAMPVVDLFYMYVEDPAINESRSDKIMMGDWDINPANGQPFSRNFWSYIVEPRKPKYPNKRLIIFTRKCVLYDGPSYYWHGMFPFVKFTPDPYPGIWNGISALWAALPLQYEIDRLYRALSDHTQKILRPPTYGDKNSISKEELNKIDPRQAGQRWRQNPHGKGVQIAEIPMMDPIVPELIKDLRDRIEQITGTSSISAALDMAAAGQTPEGNTAEKILRMVSVQNRARSMQLERAQIEVGAMQVYNFMEFYDEPRRFAILGDDGVTVEDFDFDPDSLIPAYTNGDFKANGVPDGNRVVDPRPRMDRAKEFGQQFGLIVRPGTLMESAGQNRKMLVMMLRSQKDFPLYATLKELGFDNLGPEPPGTIIEQIQAEQQLAAQAAASMPQFMGQPGGGSGGGSGDGDEHAREGRPNTFQQDPHMEGSNTGNPKNSTS